MASKVESQKLSKSISDFGVDLYQVITKQNFHSNYQDLIEHFIDYRNVSMNQPIKI